jgi:hypothetical protein
MGPGIYTSSDQPTIFECRRGNLGFETIFSSSVAGKKARYCRVPQNGPVDEPTHGHGRQDRGRGMADWGHFGEPIPSSGSDTCLHVASNIGSVRGVQTRTIPTYLGSTVDWLHARAFLLQLRTGSSWRVNHMRTEIRSTQTPYMRLSTRQPVNGGHAEGCRLEASWAMSRSHQACPVP